MHRQETNNNGFAKNGINVRNEKDYATALTARMAKCGMTDNYIEEPLACASRGRNPDNPSDRTIGSPTEQRLEINQNGTTNTITTVQKDNYVVEPKIIQVGNIGNTNRFGGNPNGGRIYDTQGICACISTMQGGGLEPKITEQYRIRKLTPRECWRLMGVRDEQFDKLHDISNSQLYKMAGNSIVVDVLMAVFKNMLLPNDDELKELATKNDMLAKENEDLKDHCNALIGLVRSLDEEQIKENKGESKMKLGKTVKIEQLGAVGRIIAIVISEYGKRYEVRYFWDGRPEQTMFFEDELTEV